MPARRARLLAAALVAALGAAASPASGAEPEEPERFAEGLDIPVDLAFGPDGTLYYAELQTGLVRTLDAQGRPSAPVARVPASPGGNGGFLGLAADPEREGVLYAYYSVEKPGADGGKVNRVVRLERGDETVLVDDIPWNMLHDGGRLLVGRDGFLYVTVGDANGKDVAQDSKSVLGKVLRLTRDGAPAPGNPEGWHPLAFAKGFRNPFGITAGPDGAIYVSDNGGQEEVNALRGGANYGWPLCTGPCGRAAVTDPVASWDAHFGPTGVAVLGRTLYLGDVVNGRVRTVDLDTGATGVLWEQDGARVLDVESGPDGCLYISGWEAVWRACGSARAPPREEPRPEPEEPAPERPAEPAPPPRAAGPPAPEPDANASAPDAVVATGPAEPPRPNAAPALPALAVAAALALLARARRPRA